MRINKLASEKNHIRLDQHTLKTIHSFAKEQDQDPNSNIKCISLIVEKDSGLYGKSLMQSEMGRRGRAFVVGLERSSGYEINPAATTVFEENDIVWVVGNKESIYEIVKENFYF